jgi:hypothetical protein
VASLIARVITARHIHVRPGLGATTSRLALQRASNAALPRISRSPSFQRWLANWEGRNQRGILNIGFARVLHFGPVILQVCGQVRFVCGRIGIGIDVFFSAPPPAEQPARSMRSAAKRQTHNTIGVPILGAIARPVIWATPSAPLRRDSFLGQALL